MPVPNDIWKKLMVNAATLSTAAPTRRTTGVLGEPRAMLGLIDAVAAEVSRSPTQERGAIDSIRSFTAIWSPEA
jgi:ketopantoate reductase